MKGSRVLGLCIVGISLAACQPACCWVKADITQTEADRDSYECRRDAAHQTAAYLHTPQSGGSYLSVPLQSTDYDESLYSHVWLLEGTSGLSKELGSTVAVTGRLMASGSSSA